MSDLPPGHDELVQKGLPCPDQEPNGCQSSNAAALYADGHVTCYSGNHNPETKTYSPARLTAMDYPHRLKDVEPGAGTPRRKPQAVTSEAQQEMEADLRKSKVSHITSRKLTKETAAAWDYRIRRKASGAIEELAPFRDTSGGLLGIKVRDTGVDTLGKDFYVIGKVSDQLWGRHRYGDGEKRSDGKPSWVLITEGEHDCMAVSQAMGLRYHIVSLPQGTQSAERAIKANLEWLLTHDRIILGFDQDAPGREAMEACFGLFPPGRLYIAKWAGGKDASELLQKGNSEDITRVVWNPTSYRPDGMIDARELSAECLEDIQVGLPWAHESLTKLTYGRRPGETYTLGSGCVDRDTEYLTPTGWAPIGDYLPGPVGQYTAAGLLEFVDPLEFVDLPCPEAFHLKTKYGVDMVLTPEHTVVSFKEDGLALQTHTLVEVMAQHESNRTGFRGLIRSGFDLPEAPPLWDPNKLRLQIAVEADGSICPRSIRKGSHVVRLKRPRKKARLVSLLRATGTFWTETDTGDYTTYRFIPPMRKGSLYAMPLGDFSRADLAVVSEEAPRWDGDNKHTFRSTHQGPADFVQYAMSSCGFKARLTTIPRPDKGHTEYLVHGTSRQYSSLRTVGGRESGPQFVPYEMARKYCFRVPSGMLVLRRNGCIFVTGNTGMGKSDELAEEIAATITGTTKYGATYEPEGFACFSFEGGGPAKLKKAIAGKIARKRFHIPIEELAGGFEWTKEELSETLRYMDTEVWDRGGKLFIYDSRGQANWDIIKSRIRFLAKSEGIKHWLLDPLSAMVTDEEDERKELDRIVLEFTHLMEEVGGCGYLVSHLTRPSMGPSHEEGGKVQLRQFRGSNGIGMFSSYVFGLERNQQADTEAERATATFRVVKDRFTGNSTGHTFSLVYDRFTGSLDEPAKGSDIV